MTEVLIAFVAAMGLPSAATGLLVWAFQRKITKRDAAKDAAEKEKEERDEEREHRREEMMLCLYDAINASIALGEATAKAVQRIPDTHCNGDMHEALQYAEEVKRRQKNFVVRQGIHALSE